MKFCLLDMLFYYKYIELSFLSEIIFIFGIKHGKIRNEVSFYSEFSNEK